MIDSYRQQDFVNQSASEVVALIGQGHNLTPVVTPTTGLVGRYYGDGYTRLSLGQFSRLRSDWDVVVQLARENSFDVFVQGRSLFFQPVLPANQALATVAISDVTNLRVERALSITQNPTARVQSWDSKRMAAEDSSAGSTSPADNIGSFLFSTANLTASQVTDSAARYSSELSRLKTVLRFQMPWDLNLLPRQNILITGTGLPLNSVFKIDSIDRRHNSTSGSTQHVHAVESD